MLTPSSEPTPLIHCDLPMTVSTVNLTLSNFGFNPGNRKTTRHHPRYCHILLSDMMKFQNSGIVLAAALTRVCEKILVNKFSCCFTPIPSFLLPVASAAPWRHPHSNLY